LHRLPIDTTPFGLHDGEHLVYRVIEGAFAVHDPVLERSRVLQLGSRSRDPAIQLSLIFSTPTTQSLDQRLF
jgi:hypothetical protein